MEPLETVRLVLLAVHILGLAAIVGTFFVKTRDGGKIMNALYRGLGVSGLLAAVAFYFVTDAMFSLDEPRTGPSGTLAWAVDVDNPATGEQFTLTLKEVLLPTPEGGHVTRPCAMGFSGNYPRALDGLARLLSRRLRRSNGMMADYMRQ